MHRHLARILLYGTLLLSVAWTWASLRALNTGRPAHVGGVALPQLPEPPPPDFFADHKEFPRALERSIKARQRRGVKLDEHHPAYQRLSQVGAPSFPHNEEAVSWIYASGLQGNVLTLASTWGWGIGGGDTSVMVIPLSNIDLTRLRLSSGKGSGASHQWTLEIHLRKRTPTIAMHELHSDCMSARYFGGEFDHYNWAMPDQVRGQQALDALTELVKVAQA